MKISCADTGIVSGNANNITRAIKTDGTLWSWGWNDFNYIGDNTTIHRSNPVQITGNNWVYVDSNVALQDDYFDYYNDNL
jgi:alpha-tubulin suppressor-like RCC1 family protein